MSTLDEYIAELQAEIGDGAEVRLSVSEDGFWEILVVDEHLSLCLPTGVKVNALTANAPAAEE